MKALKFKLDSCGFPMLWISRINAYIHWIPLTKIQCEYFLTSTPDDHFNVDWYEYLLSLNPRTSIGNIRTFNYWNAFLTGITPDELIHLARWFGEGYDVPTAGDWFLVYEELSKRPAAYPTIFDEMSISNERIRLILNRLDTTSKLLFERFSLKRTLADQMFLRFGVMEWVRLAIASTQCGVMGQTIREFSDDFSPTYLQHSSSFTTTNTSTGTHIEYLTRLRKILDTRFSQEELRTLCFDLGVDYDNLPSEGKTNKARELVNYLNQRFRLPDLVVVGKQLREDIVWEDISKTTIDLGYPYIPTNPSTSRLNVYGCRLIWRQN